WPRIPGRKSFSASCLSGRFVFVQFSQNPGGQSRSVREYFSVSLTNAIYQVTGDVSFTPDADKTYYVKGELGDNYSAVWLEDSDTHVVIDKKIELNGSAKLGIMDK
ncbi:MAG: hypothetical protein PHR30_07885, partial [Gallionellaceae bacterium]|nr:hypothetical protein [Gallionellaceae bacterium]